MAAGEISSDTMTNVHEQLVLYLYGSGDEVGEKPSNAMCLLRKQQVSDKTLILVFKSLISLYAKVSTLFILDLHFSRVYIFNYH